jgi:hypothetical protein
LHTAHAGPAVGDDGVVGPPNHWRSVMKKIIAALIALSALNGVAASANAFDAKSFYEELDRGRT